ncbi:hypothetical protein EFA69_19780 [Rufibacter immobilis]|uniref:Uncharacterized protein n=1 Tax=Rufibacter immobilis TaxID=1348778 RepID=A0A3M9MU93_9BACT|nr:hypothetical protein [Rufibacter immobilis]RNI28298.1 hypothetical protein EFA69_19780 [Rufibacter immobilis]
MYTVVYLATERRKEQLEERKMKSVKKETAKPISAAFAKMIERKREIHEHIKKGGSFEQLEAKGYKFVTPL